MNPNKRKGDRAEMAARDWLNKIWPTKRTRAGFDDDLGDLIAHTPRGLLCVQVKDVAKPEWSKWFTQLAMQINTLTERTDKRVLGGVILWKLRGKSDPGKWRVVVQLEDLPELIDGPTYV